jgi:hypothetical protein
MLLGLAVVEVSILWRIAAAAALEEEQLKQLCCPNILEGWGGDRARGRVEGGVGGLWGVAVYVRINVTLSMDPDS